MLQCDIMLFSQHCLLYTENREQFLWFSSVVKQILSYCFGVFNVFDV